MGEHPQAEEAPGSSGVAIGHDLRASTGVRNEETADTDLRGINISGQSGTRTTTGTFPLPGRVKFFFYI